jgi:probable phosphoglycerate mutase
MSDPSISEEGRRQADAVAARLIEEPVAAVFVTTLRRTLQTAEPLVNALGLAPTSVDDLREVHLGEWEGGLFERHLANGHHLALRLFEQERWDVIPGAESMESLATRVRRGLEYVAASVGPGAVAVAYVHGGVVAEACRQVTGSRAFAFVAVENGSITRLIRLADGQWQLRSFNETWHLDVTTSSGHRVRNMRPRGWAGRSRGALEA